MGAGLLELGTGLYELLSLLQVCMNDFFSFFSLPLGGFDNYYSTCKSYFVC